MIHIFSKEFNGFLNSLIAYMVIGVFLTAIGLLIWVFPETSVLDYGYADLDTLFSTGPYVLIFLVPAITMKSFAEEKKLGTLELLLTKPLTDWQIILGKFLAAFALVLVSLIPTLICYYSIYRLGSPVGNIDTPGVIGSYLGLALLGGVFCSVGILASSLTTNQIVAFIMAAFFCFILYSGFDSLSTLASSGDQVLWIRQLGIVYHYEAMSKGLIDSRDLVYFFSLIALMVLVTRMILGSRQWQPSPWKKSRQWGDWLLLANGLALIALIHLLASSYFFRIDLTDEKRYTIKEPTRKLLEQLDDDVYVEVFLEGDLNPGFRRFRKSVAESLEEFRIYSNNRVHYTFTDPTQATSEKAKNEFMAELASKGVQGTRVIDTKQGERIEKIVFPGAVVSYNGFESGVMLLKGNRSQNSQEVLNQSIEGVEFELANEISKLTLEHRKRIGLITGHGELDSLAVAGFNNALLESFDVFRLDLSKKKTVSNYDVLIIAKPTRPFSEADKYKLDQYLMHGGKMLFLVDGMDAVMDSANRDDYFAFPYELKLDDQLFRYGVRINRDLIQDRVSGKYPVVINESGGKPELMAMEWPFYPLAIRYAPHAITRNLDATELKFVSSIDTVKAEGVKKTPLLFSSSYAHKAGAPVRINIRDLQKKENNDAFHEGPFPLGYLLEGRFSSLYKNRFPPSGVDTAGFVAQSVPTQIIVIPDGDVARNDINTRTRQPIALGLDPVTGYTFANEDLLINMVDYLTEQDGLISARTKEVRIRPLDKTRIRTERTYWQVLNLALPLAAIIFFGMGRSFMRKRKYASF